MNDHIPDLTKMISDTPRTDQIEKLAYWFQDDMTPVCESRFVRTIERELNEANDRIKRLEEAGDVLCAAAAFMGWHMEIENWNKAKEANP
jgi:hypothetical protein